ncbi:MAG TPA: hypothetical protein VMQ99_04640 [Acetobacteraceae bacterium]|nr:hypothetical protein [Acetobacteraceae bacterium]
MLTHGACPRFSQEVSRAALIGNVGGGRYIGAPKTSTAFWPRNQGEDATRSEQPAIIRAKDMLEMTSLDFAVRLSLLCRQLMLLDRNDLLTWAIRGIVIE